MKLFNAIVLTVVLAADGASADPPALATTAAHRWFAAVRSGELDTAVDLTGAGFHTNDCPLKPAPTTIRNQLACLGGDLGKLAHDEHLKQVGWGTYTAADVAGWRSFHGTRAVGDAVAPLLHDHAVVRMDFNDCGGKVGTSCERVFFVLVIGEPTTAPRIDGFFSVEVALMD